MVIFTVTDYWSKNRCVTFRNRNEAIKYAVRIMKRHKLNTEPPVDRYDLEDKDALVEFANAIAKESSEG